MVAAWTSLSRWDGIGKKESFFFTLAIISWRIFRWRWLLEESSE